MRANLGNYMLQQCGSRFGHPGAMCSRGQNYLNNGNVGILGSGFQNRPDLV